ncbi:hypothetical protein FN846DRAFT_894744 [Sphaerosporella brunnea]|uniref:Uncharacterized protein n=1 Tax=Sphaerosporella brunnea TaxID=1250544 RepID=A0A5J5EJB1_9PEZI|nr:hypothetical protein FN846DRAFT_894744 [Sphaerosporella brunnea]
MPKQKKKDVSPADAAAAAAARLAASLDRLQAPCAVARDVVSFDELEDMRTWVLEQLSEPRQEREAGPQLVTVPSIAPLWMRDGQHAVWDRQDNPDHANPPERPNDDEGERETGDDDQHIDLVGEPQEDDATTEPGVRPQGGSQPTPHRSQHDETEKLEDGEIAYVSPLSPGFVSNFHALRSRRASDHTFEQILESYAAERNGLSPHDDPHSDLVGEAQEDDAGIQPGVRPGRSQPTPDHFQHDKTEQLEDGEIAYVSPLSPGFVANFHALRSRRASDHTFEQILESYAAERNGLSHHDDQHIDLVGEAQEDDAGIQPAVRPRGSQPTPDRSPHDETEQLEDGEIANVSPLPGFLARLRAARLLRASEHTSGQVVES